MTPLEAPVGRLVVCPTPIGNLEDVTLRVLEQLRGADTIACEDTRHTGRLLARHGIDGHLVSFHEHNEHRRVAELLERMRAGETVALVSDAGMPLLSDPGYELLRCAIAAAEVEVEVLPGASAVPTALVASGLPAAAWRFVGFLPRRRGELKTLFAHASETLVAFESPRRLAATLAALAELDPARPVSVCRELTKRHEEVRRGDAAQLAAHYREHPPRGEVALVCGAATREAADLDAALDAVRELVAAGARARGAAGVVARLTGASANELYRKLTEQ